MNFGSLRVNILVVVVGVEGGGFINRVSRDGVVRDWGS